MFGRDNSQDSTDGGQPVPVSVVTTSSDGTDTPSAPIQEDGLNLPAPAGEPMADDTLSVPEMTPESVDETSFVQIPTTDIVSSSPPITISSSGTMKDLGSLKQEALRELSPLIGQLDQSPEEKYATAKMVYEETNDQALLTSVYDAAKNLPDEKAKAEAIYDVIKKINAFSATN